MSTRPLLAVQVLILLGRRPGVHIFPAVRSAGPVVTQISAPLFAVLLRVIIMAIITAQVPLRNVITTNPGDGAEEVIIVMQQDMST